MEPYISWKKYSSIFSYNGIFPISVSWRTTISTGLQAPPLNTQSFHVHQFTPMAPPPATLASISSSAQASSPLVWMTSTACLTSGPASSFLLSLPSKSFFIFFNWWLFFKNMSHHLVLCSKTWMEWCSLQNKVQSHPDLQPAALVPSTHEPLLPPAVSLGSLNAFTPLCFGTNLLSLE